MGKKVEVGKTDLATTNPQLAEEWHPSKNLPLTPRDVFATTTKKYWWVCETGHEWEAVGESRAKGTGCPYCAGKKVLAGFNDLPTTHPKLAQQWHPTKNLPLLPSAIVAGTSKQISWLCELGHEWQARGSKRVQGQGCPFCSGRLVKPGDNDLATTNPTLASEWHPTRNRKLTPSDITAGSGISVWWQCEKGHEWQVSPDKRKSGSGCPVCIGQLVQVGFNDLTTTHPDIAAQWHREKNGPTTPFDVVAGTNKKFWWVCVNGHEWQAPGANRVRGAGCPVCAGQKVLAGFNDFASRNPQLVKEWHPTKNGDLSPDAVMAGSGRLFWWQCAIGHEWQAGPYQRAQGAGCPICSGRVAWSGFNDLASTHPELAAQWHPTKNAGVAPSNFIAGTNKKIWWICDLGHEWQASGNKRVIGTGCPECATSGFDPGKPALFYFIENVNLAARKVGITNVGTDRLAYFRRNGWRIVKTVENENAREIRLLESILLGWIRIDLGLPAYLNSKQMGRRGGWTETFSLEGPSNAEVMRRIEEATDWVIHSSDSADPSTVGDQ
jgi:Probable Zinc-ribbon domain